jgi:hypothetical protein
LQLCADKYSWEFNDFMPVKIIQTSQHSALKLKNVVLLDFTSNGVAHIKQKFSVCIFLYWAEMCNDNKNKNKTKTAAAAAIIFFLTL